MTEDAPNSDQLIRVTDTQLTVGDQTYDLAGITSARIREVTDKARWRRWLWISAAVLLVWSVIFAVWIYPMGDVRLLFLAIVPLAWFFITMRWGQTIDYVLTLDTLFGSVDVASSKDKAHIRKLFNAIDPAIRERNWP